MDVLTHINRVMEVPIYVCVRSIGMANVILFTID